MMMMMMMMMMLEVVVGLVMSESHSMAPSWMMVCMMSMMSMLS